AGTLTIATNRLILQDAALITSATLGLGDANDLRVEATDSILVTDGSLLSAQTTGGGKAGDLTLVTGKLTVRNEGQLSTSGQGEFSAGTLLVNADAILLDNQAGIRAETEAGDRGNIVLQLQDFLLLNQGSGILTNATGTATGGDITIATPNLVLLEDSSIFAQAIAGQGGNIQLTTQGFFQLSGSQIDASSALGIDGVVTIDTPDTNPIQPMVELSADVVNANDAIALSCVNTGNPRRGRFVVTGTGGLPTLPGDPSNFPFRTYVVPPAQARALSALSVVPDPLQANRPLVEAEGIYHLEDGRVILGRECL
ncbi:MAG: S-layer family protein, partial [Cyanothece sp. SIO1E1]|nr:S-layer family protein [Cyanothece sp. SIO1E1]